MLAVAEPLVGALWARGGALASRQRGAGVALEGALADVGVSAGLAPSASWALATGLGRIAGHECLLAESPLHSAPPVLQSQGAFTWLRGEGFAGTHLARGRGLIG